MTASENMLQWSHIPCMQGNQEQKKKIWLYYIYQSKCIHLSVCLPHCNGGNKRQELMFSSAISVWLHGIWHRILHFITHREANSHFNFTPTCYKIRTESIQTITKKEFLYLASVGGNALNEGGGSFLKIFFSFLSLSLVNISSSLLLLLLLCKHVSCIVWAKY